MTENNNKATEFISPLFNHLVLEKIMSYLHHQDWKSVRLVCSFWNEVLLKTYLNKNSEIYLEDSSFEQFLKILEQCSKFKLPHPEFENYKIKINSVMSTAQNVNNLWTEIGENIKNLRIDITTLYAERQLRQILLEKMNSLETLKLMVSKYWGSAKDDEQSEHLSTPNQIHIQPNSHLTSFSYTCLCNLSIYGVEQGNDNFKFPITSNQFFQRFNNLKRISLIGMSQIELSDFISGLKYLQMDKKSKSNSLEILEILDENMCPEAPNNDHIKTLTNLNLPLKELHLEISYLLVTNLLNEFISKLATTLKILRLRRFPLPYQLEPLEPISLKFPMKYVTFLEISNDLVPSLEFLPFFPLLETLHVLLRDYRSLSSCEIVENTPSFIEPHGRMKYLYIEPPLVSEDCITKLGKLFPSLKRLKLRMDDEMMRTLYGSTASNVLEELHVVSWGGLTDEGFTGMKDTESIRIYPYIGDLHNLQKLTVEMWADYSNHITDASVYYGFMDLVNLNKFVAIRTLINPNVINLMNIAECTIED